MFIARHGHSVAAVDLSPSGIRDLQQDAKAEGLEITAEVADICEYKSRHRFDLILIDRTLHMLALEERESVLQKLLTLSKRGTHVLIADERSNILIFKSVQNSTKWEWTIMLERHGFVFVQRD
ncbi:MAG: class I SAM-dependent methyltransferase [Candidatus Thiodiazotropha sp. (ex Semelilucina semeliformis)]|nr:class I SAM-dependent methyltransferase [Candidatus Thiodiazotropha sp. (ex Semelilucina semeliformis)]